VEAKTKVTMTVPAKMFPQRRKEIEINGAKALTIFKGFIIKGIV
jgi:hypothetical protein